MIRFGALDFGKPEREAIIDLIYGEDPQLTMGKKVYQFEREFAAWLGSKYAVMVNSGTSALIVALEAYTRNFVNLVPLIAPALTFPAVWNALRDVYKTLFQIQDVESDFVMHSHSTHYLAVDLLGKPCQVPDQAIVVEDACEALGSSLNHKKCGTRGALGCFSFYVNHQMTTIEGGMIVTDNEELYRACRMLRDNGRICICPVCTLKTSGVCKNRETFTMERRWQTGTLHGYNMKPTEIQGALGLVKMCTINENIARRNKIFRRYTEAFNTLTQESNEFIVPMMYPVKVKDPIKAVATLEKANIESRGMFSAYNDSYPVASELSRTHILIPLHHKMNDPDVEYVIDKVKEIRT